MRQLGNAVPVDLARRLGQTVRAALSQTRERRPGDSSDRRRAVGE
jgi:hypothetical protein